MPYIAVRDPFAEAKDTLSSWDKCMEKTYCKWPVIVAIIIGSIIVLSTVLCVVRCIFCGVKCATCCCSCCSCGSSDNSGHKRMNSNDHGGHYPQAYNGPPIPPPAIGNNQQYRSHAAPTFNPAPAPAPYHEEPQYARFESPSKPVNEDSLPAMPSYSEAKISYVEEEVVPEKRGDMEMDRLNQNGSVTGVAAVGNARRSPGPGTGRSPVHRSPSQDTYGFPPGYQNSTTSPPYGQNDSFVSAAPQRSPHNSPGPYGAQNYYEEPQNGYRGMSPVQNLSPVYGAGAGAGAAAGYAQTQQYDRRSPQQDYNQQDYNQQYGQPGPRRSPAPPAQNSYDDYGYDSQDRNQGPLEMPQHNNYAPGRTPSPGYAPTGSTQYEPPAPVYPGQQTYASEPAYPGQQAYQAFQPQDSGVGRRPVNNSWKEV